MTTADDVKRLFIAIPHIERALIEREACGCGYSDYRLERKRREAITWLRTHSKKGWARDIVWNGETMRRKL